MSPAQRAAIEIHTGIEAALPRLLTGAGLRWSPLMDPSDPHADWLVVDDQGREYTVEIDVWLQATGNHHGPSPTA